MAPSGTGLPLAGNPSLYTFTITGFATIPLMQPVFDVPHPLASSGWLTASIVQES